jgi:hypothetical protein
MAASSSSLTSDWPPRGANAVKGNTRGSRPDKMTGRFVACVVTMEHGGSLPTGGYNRAGSTGCAAFSCRASADDAGTLLRTGGLIVSYGIKEWKSMSTRRVSIYTQLYSAKWRARPA